MIGKYGRIQFQDYPIGGHILACKLLSLELHTLFGVSYGKFRFSIYLQIILFGFLFGKYRFSMYTQMDIDSERTQ